MSDLKTFDLLANGVIVFKNKKIEFINQRMLDVLNLNFLSKKNAIDILLKTIKIESEEELCLFFSKYDYFRHNSKVIIIEANHYSQREIFSFTPISNSLLTSIQNQDDSDIKEIEINSKITNLFQIQHIKKLQVLTFYKGIPLKNFGKIIRTTDESIEVEVDPKHHISLLKRDDVLLMAHTEKGNLVVHGHVKNTHNNIFTINSLSLTKDDMHLRESIRIKPSKQIVAHIKNREFKIYDISQKGISLSVVSQEDEIFLKKSTSLNTNISYKEVTLEIKYLKTVYKNDGSALKIIFLILSAGKSLKVIKEYVNSQQNVIIREIHNYLQNN